MKIFKYERKPSCQTTYNKTTAVEALVSKLLPANIQKS